MMITRRCFADITKGLAPYVKFYGNNGKLPELMQAITTISSQFAELQPPTLTQNKLAKVVAMFRQDERIYEDYYASYLPENPGLPDMLCCVLFGVHNLSRMPSLTALRAGMSLFGGKVRFGRMVRFFQSVAKDVNAR